MKVQRVKIVKFKKLENIDVELNGANVILRSDNETGKTSFFNFVEIALGAKNKIPTNGTGKGTVWIDKNGLEYKCEVKIEGGKSKIVMTAPDGVKEDNQSVIRALTGVVEFDIGKFVANAKTKAGRKEMIEDFKNLLPEEVKTVLNDIEKEIDNAYEERTEVGRKVKEVKGAIANCKLYGDDLKITPVDVTQLNIDLQKANEFNQKIKDVKSRSEARQKSIEERDKRIEDLKAEIAELERVGINEKQVQKDAEKWIKEKGIEVDASAIATKISGASDTNVKYSQAQEQNARIASLEKWEEHYGELEVLINLKREAIAEAIRNMDSPVPGLLYDDETLLYNGVVVEESSMARSSIEMLGIAMRIAANPDYGIMIVEDSNLLGAKKYEEVLRMSSEMGLQAFIEVVERGVETLQIEISDY